MLSGVGGGEAGGMASVSCSLPQILHYSRYVVNFLLNERTSGVMILCLALDANVLLGAV